MTTPADNTIPNDNDLVSIVIPCYGQAHFLPDAINSALAQTYKHVEVIVVDDGSPDNTAEVAGEFQSIQLIRQQNQGLSAARNAGYRACRGDFVAFLDADDVLLPAAIEHGLAEFKRHPEASFVAGAHVRVNVDREPISEPVVPKVGKADYATFLRCNPIGMHGTVLFRRFALEQAGGFDVQATACEDYDLYLRISREGDVYLYPHVIAEYRRHGKNMSGDRTFMLSEVLRVLYNQRAHVESNPELFAAYQQGFEIWTEYYRSVTPNCENPGSTSAVTAKSAATAANPKHRGASSLLRKLKRSVAARLPMPIRERLRRSRSNSRVAWGNLRRVEPFSKNFGFDRGRPVDRYYIEQFLANHSEDVRGRVLEIGDDAYSRQFGGAKIQQQHILHVNSSAAKADIVADLADADHLPSDQYDCIIFTQTLQLIFDWNAALHTLSRILRPGGVLLLTAPGISQIDRDEWGKSWYWAFTPHALQRMLQAHFPAEQLEILSFGNVLTAVAFLYGLADHELNRQELDASDTAYPLLVAARAVKPVAES